MIDVTPNKNYLEEITELYVFVSSDENGEGVIGMKMGETFMPFVCADKERLDQLKPHAIAIGKHIKKNVKLIKLSQREELETYEP